MGLPAKGIEEPFHNLLYGNGNMHNLIKILDKETVKVKTPRWAWYLTVKYWYKKDIKTYLCVTETIRLFVQTDLIKAKLGGFLVVFDLSHLFGGQDLVAVEIKL